MRLKSSVLVWLASMVLLLGLGVLWLGSGLATFAIPAAPAVTVTSPSGVGADVVGEGDDYFTRVLGDPRDMQHHTDLTWQEFGITNISMSNGVWSGTTSNSNGGQSRIWSLYPGHTKGGVAEIGKIGWNYPVNTSKYKQLSFRLKAPQAGQWIAAYSTVSNTEYSNFRSGSYSVGWQVYSTTFTWSGSVYGLVHQFGPVGIYQVDWIRLTDPSTSPVYTIRFNVSGTAADAVVDLACHTSATITNDTYCGPIATGIAVGTGGSFTYDWRTAYLAPGTYYVRAEIRQGGTLVASDVSDGPLTIKPAPIIEFDSPSMTSGPDYATVELGNPWDMNDAGDLKLVGGNWTIHDLQICAPGATPPAPCFNGGELYATTGRLDPNDPPGFSDPFVYLNVDPTRPIDTAKYKYLTYRYKIDRTPWWAHSGDRLADSPPGSGIYRAAWVVRLIFFGNALPDFASINETNDIIGFDDWNTYQMDLSQGQARDYWESEQPQTGGYWTGFKTWLRFDFLEGVDPWTIHLDDVKLTGDNTADTAFVVGWSLAGGTPPSSIRFYAHTNPASCGSGSPIYTWPPPASPPGTGPYFVYLPLIQRTGITTSSGFSWNTSGRAPGAYYVCAVADDGYNTSRWVSQVPVVVSH